VFIPAWAADALRDEISERGLSGTDPIFTIPYDTVYDEHKRACKLAGIHDYTTHDHRHTAAVSLVRAGMPLNILAQQLGHKTIKMTMRYATYNTAYADAAPYFGRVAESYGLAASDSSGNTPAEAEAEANA
jgi:integrase